MLINRAFQWSKTFTESDTITYFIQFSLLYEIMLCIVDSFDPSEDPNYPNNMINRNNVGPVAIGPDFHLINDFWNGNEYAILLCI